MVGKAKSCTACRQAKMACDARNKAPKPCSRCSSRKLECRFDKNFRRVSTRQITQDITNGIHIMRASQEPPKRVPLSDACPAFLPCDLNELANQSLGSLSIPPAVLIELLLHFERHYYPHATFIRPIQSLTRFISDSPLLFWTIVLIASQYYEKQASLYPQLTLSHQELLAPLLNTAIQSIEDIHAILLLSLWPIPRRKALVDPSWSYIGIAINTCMRMNFHKPTEGPSENNSVQSQRLTWVACFSIGTQEATFLGLVPPLASYHQLKYVRNAVEYLSLELRASFAIHEVICNYSISLEDIEDEAVHFSLIQTFDSVLDTIRQTHSAYWTLELDFLFQYAKLNLYATVLLITPQTNDTIKSSYILRGLVSACRLIGHMKSIRTISGDKIASYPRNFFTNLLFTATFLFRIFNNATQAHKTTIIQGLIDSQEVFQSVSSNQEFAKGARLIQKLINKIHSADALLEADLAITNRLGSSLLWDTIFRIRTDMKPDSLTITDHPSCAPGMEGRSLEDQTTLLDTEDCWASVDSYINDFGFDITPQIFL